jgi:hypothetical protein
MLIVETIGRIRREHLVIDLDQGRNVVGALRLCSAGEKQWKKSIT